MSKSCRIALITVALMVVGANLVSAQAWRGMGRLAGKVTDEGGAPIEGVTVKVYHPEAKGGTEVKTNKKGEWVLGGIARGGWQVDFLKNGYEPRQITVDVNESSSNPPVVLSLKKVAPQADPNVELRGDLERAAALLNQKQYAEARAIYSALLEKYPEAHQLHPLIARTYYGENQFEQSIEHLRIALQKDPENVEVKLLLGNILVERGNADEGKQLLAGIDDSKVKDPTTFLNVGIVLLNQNKPADAQTYFEKTIKLFPAYPDAYYYRGLSYLQTGNTDAAKADLTKFLELAPHAPEAVTAKKILEQLKWGFRLKPAPDSVTWSDVGSGFSRTTFILRSRIPAPGETSGGTGVRCGQMQAEGAGAAISRMADQECPNPRLRNDCTQTDVGRHLVLALRVTVV